MWSESLSSDDVVIVERILARGYDRVLGNLGAERARLTILAAALADRQEMAGDEVRALLAAPVAAPAAEPVAASVQGGLTDGA
jgi:hypothetical protein